MKFITECKTDLLPTKIESVQIEPRICCEADTLVAVCQVLPTAQLPSVVLALQVAVDHLVKVVEVVLSVAVALPLGSGCLVDSEAGPPAVVLAKGDEDVATGIVDTVLEVTGTGGNVVLWVLAVYALLALVVGDLHETVLTTRLARSTGLAGGLLVGDSREKSRGETISLTVTPEDVKVLAADGKVGVVESDKAEIPWFNVGRFPASRLDAAVEPVLATVGAVDGGLGATTAVVLDADELASWGEGVRGLGHVGRRSLLLGGRRGPLLGSVLCRGSWRLLFGVTAVLVALVLLGGGRVVLWDTVVALRRLAFGSGCRCRR